MWKSLSYDTNTKPMYAKLEVHTMCMINTPDLDLLKKFMEPSWR